MQAETDRSVRRGSVETSARLDWIRDRLRADGEVRAQEVITAFEVSDMTVRRDLGTLEALGEASRVRGGAVALGAVPFEGRQRLNARAKAQIAAKLIDLVPSRGAIAIDSSSTMACLARLIGPSRDLVVVTNGSESFEALQGTPGVRAVLTGGEREQRTGSLVGPAALASARAFTFEVAFISAHGVHTEFGASEVCPEEAEIVRAYTERSASTVLGADASKLGQADVSVSLTWSQIDLLATELTPTSRRLEQFREHVEIR